MKSFLKNIIMLWLLLFSFQAAADGINATRHEGRVLSNGKLAISSRFKTELPEQLKEALLKGVPLDFALTYQLERPTLTSYRVKLNQWVSNNEHTVNYRLSFHPLTNKYRVSVGTFSSEYNNLDIALRAVGAIVNWRVLHEGALSNTDTQDIRAQVRLNLSTSKLPKPFQLNALTASHWDLDSGWINLNINP
ncbi:DUF4390 domain-containing protein [Alysiella filiformis]|uniref:DUF4390 domain-containing protein n=1 Tax=Alysiella filiformis DSM 16848 TaxID=1120981 RepID=A0A286EGN8_9NEIS|nr:DUF4390 domain-containing protein [Alysiella filiformis]QMT30539.1 DUF4390 domain-containing protein [Alysiella filiformis]UBQ56481.1 DUF4390 domain-containing protein [Alysiella filiformis DSM 16848]SOD69974.1 protein of unknown function [Alysiella filiformis DSM 16848]